VVALDLTRPDATSVLASQTADLEVGLYISNAGADSHGQRFLDLPIDEWLKLLQRNTVALMSACHHFGGAMRRRGRGGMILMSSGAGLGGGPRIAVYSSTKAFEIAFAESLWAELGSAGVDVLGVVTPPTNTPAMQRLLARRGLQGPSLYEPHEVATAAVRALPNGPTYLFPLGDVTAEMATALAQQRRDRVAMVARGSAAFFGD
jgi:short-subunit dehydrogenase